MEENSARVIWFVPVVMTLASIAIGLAAVLALTTLLLVMMG